jgi:hypothetical protein
VSSSIPPCQLSISLFTYLVPSQEKRSYRPGPPLFSFGHSFTSATMNLYLGLQIIRKEPLPIYRTFLHPFRLPPTSVFTPTSASNERNGRPGVYVYIDVLTPRTRKSSTTGARMRHRTSRSTWEIYRLLSHSIHRHLHLPLRLQARLFLV